MTVFGGDDLLVGQLNGVTDRPRVNLLLGTPSIANNSIQALTPTSAPVNVGGMWTSGTNITIPSGMGGEYDIGIVCRYASQAVATGMRMVRIHIDGVEYMYNPIPVGSGHNATNVPVLLTVSPVLTAGQVVTFHAFQTSGGALSLAGASHAWVRKVIGS